MSEVDNLIVALLKDNDIDSPMRFVNINLDDPCFEKKLELKKLREIPGMKVIIFDTVDEIK